VSKVFGLILAFLFVIFLGGALLHDNPAEATESNYGYGPRYVAGTIRLDSSGNWSVLNGSGHEPLGGLSIAYVTHDRIVLNMTHTDTIHSFICGPDETYAPWNYTCGISAGLDQITVKIGYWGSVADPATMYGGPYSNFWIQGLVQG
jgi:hypothetical protein